MIRWLLVVMLVGCVPSEPIAPDAAPDAPVVPTCTGLTAERSFGAPIGACCDESVAPLCATGAGACVVDHCVRQCTGHYPPCADGTEAVWRNRPDGGGIECTCPG